MCLSERESIPFPSVSQTCEQTDQDVLYAITKHLKSPETTSEMMSVLCSCRHCGWFLNRPFSRGFDNLFLIWLICRICISDLTELFKLLYAYNTKWVSMWLCLSSCDPAPALKSADVSRHICWYFSAHQTFTSFTSWCADAGHIRAQRSSSIIDPFVNIMKAIQLFLWTGIFKLGHNL